MGIRKDWKGQKFGMLTFIEPTDERDWAQIVWKIQCDCGEIILRASTRIVAGKTESCGCLNRTNYSGQKFGMLTFIEPTNEKSGGRIVWKLQCDCGKTVSFGSKNVVNGNTKSCGCLSKKDWSGQKFGRITFIEPTSKRKNGQVVWRVKCDCNGDVILRKPNAIIQGRTKSCGCLNKDANRARFIERTPEYLALKRRKNNARAKKQRAKNPLRYAVSSAIKQALNENSSSKKGKSCFNYLPYTTQELRNYIGELFEPWMNWNNYGKYLAKEWDDENLSTWTWSLDHIIPQSDLPYTSMDDENFKRCWALENLRPLPAKQNVIEGTRRTRHQPQHCVPPEQQ